MSTTHRIAALFLFVAVLLFTGCSGKQYYEPTQTFSANKVSNSYGGHILDLRRDGATLTNKKYIGRFGVGSIKLKKGFTFLDENSDYVLSGNAQGVLMITDKKVDKVLRAVVLGTPIVSVSMKKGLVAYLLNSNVYGIYKMSNNHKLVESRSEKTFAIDTRAASPLFVDDLAIFPMLDGKIIIVDSNKPTESKVIYISSNKVFNNVIFLSRLKDTLVAATSARIITLGKAGRHEYNANISEVRIGNSAIYLFTKEGEVIKLNESLKKVSKIKFKFAHFAVAAAFDGKVYALDQQGLLIVLNADLSRHKTYELGDIDEPAYITGKKLYKDGKVIDLSALDYE